MLDFIKKGIFASIGVAVLTKDKILEATRLLVEEGKISTEDAEKLSEDLVQKGERQWDEINAKMQDSYKQWSASINVVRRKEFDDLRARVEELEKRAGIQREPETKEAESAGEDRSQGPA